MRTTESPPEHPAATPPDGPRAPKAVARAWTAIALIPVFFFIAMAVGESLMSLLGYPSGGAAPAWVTVVTDVAATVTVLLPCLAAVSSAAVPLRPVTAAACCPPCWDRRLPDG